ASTARSWASRFRPRRASPRSRSRTSSPRRRGRRPARGGGTGWQPSGAPDQTHRMARILVTEKIADGGLDRLRSAGHEVDVRNGLSPAELLDAIVGAHALIIRSATQVTDEVLAAGSDLLVVGRAG